MGFARNPDALEQDMKLTCETCQFWGWEVEDTGEPLTHQCRRYAPRPMSWRELGTEEPGWAEWPRTLPDDWCGEHTAKETEA